MTKQEIPRRVFFFWTGPMSWLRYATLASFKRQNPGWEVVLAEPDPPCLGKKWTTHEEDDRSYAGRDYREDLDALGVSRVVWVPPVLGLGPAQASDVYQWEVLADGGGFYSDMDVLWLRPLDDLPDSVRGADVILCLEGGLMAIGIVGAVPECRLLGDLHRLSASPDRLRDYQGCGVLAVYDLAGAQRAKVQVLPRLRQRYPELEIEVVPDETVYPFSWQQIPSIFEEDHPLPSGCFGVHWFGGDPIAQKWGRLLTEDGWKEHQNTLTSALKKSGVAR